MQVSVLKFTVAVYSPILANARPFDSLSAILIMAVEGGGERV